MFLVYYLELPLDVHSTESHKKLVSQHFHPCIKRHDIFYYSTPKNVSSYSNTPFNKMFLAVTTNKQKNLINPDSVKPDFA
jgi:hypothetical protein